MYPGAGREPGGSRAYILLPRAGTAGTKVLLVGTWPGPGPDMDKNSYPRTRPELKIEGHPGAGPGAGQRFQPPAGTRTQISVPRRPLVCTP